MFSLFLPNDILDHILSTTSSISSEDYYLIGFVSDFVFIGVLTLSVHIKNIEEILCYLKPYCISSFYPGVIARWSHSSIPPIGRSLACDPDNRHQVVIRTYSDSLSKTTILDQINFKSLSIIYLNLPVWPSVFSMNVVTFENLKHYVQDTFQYDCSSLKQNINNTEMTSLSPPSRETKQKIGLRLTLIQLNQIQESRMMLIRKNINIHFIYIRKTFLTFQPYQLFHYIIICCGRIYKTLCQCQYQMYYLVQYILTHSLVWQTLQIRFQLCYQYMILYNFIKEENQFIMAQQYNDFPSYISFDIMTGSIFYSLVIDSMLGIIFSFIPILLHPVQLFNDSWSHVLSSLILQLTSPSLGLKLNKSLGVFLSHGVLSTTQLWSFLLSHQSRYRVIHLLRHSVQWCSRLFGASMMLSLLFDIYQILTFHVCYAYAVLGRFVAMALFGLHSLYLLFRGLKWNVLRQRVDSSQADLDQLIIGAILFTIVQCLFPTVIVFYIGCALCWIGLLSIQLVLYSVSCLLTSIPWYLWRLEYHQLFMSGITFETFNQLNSADMSTYHCSQQLLLQLKPFHCMMTIPIKILQSCYSPFLTRSILKKFLTGKPVFCIITIRGENQTKSLYPFLCKHI